MASLGVDAATPGLHRPERRTQVLPSPTPSRGPQPRPLVQGRPQGWWHTGSTCISQPARPTLPMGPNLRHRCEQEQLRCPRAPSSAMAASGGI